MENLEYPKAAKENELEGQVYVRFEVKKNGTIGEVIISKSVHPVLDAEAIRVVKEMPEWIPGRYDGKPVNSWFTLPILFFLVPSKNNHAKQKVTGKLPIFKANLVQQKSSSQWC